MKNDRMTLGVVYSLINGIVIDPVISNNNYVRTGNTFSICTVFVNDKRFSLEKSEWQNYRKELNRTNDKSIKRLVTTLDGFYNGSEETRNYLNQYIASIKVIIKNRPTANPSIVRHSCFVEFSRDDFGENFNVTSDLNEKDCSDCKSLCGYIKSKINNDAYDKILSASPGRAQEKSARTG
jgi:hypothetical protein